MKDRLQYISQGQTAAEQELNIRKAFDNGATWVQLRWKEASLSDLLTLAETVVMQSKAYGGVCIINDHIHVAQAVEADGVHLGLTDDTITEARKLLGPNKIIGGTANTLTDVSQRIQEGCDYIGLGPFRFTTTKEKLSPVLGLDGYTSIMQGLKANFHPPIYAIGGIQLEDIPLLRSIGLYGVAVSGLIGTSPDCIPKIKTLLNS
ncbi:thiamine phosphate synthase [Sphingobacterium wenxiniae]|uniref:Thiamine-phosphate synthase n=1 Tax=Sphingobacterium wenxiniae TaxID=683125 RepID=A0A1I6Q0C7_9SPHI|nr:thiamine phosphate synthase [Sphingobacterium wenxiniae]SFS45872.1 thiamine-phosphate diphosphorylase [Sphingobacterium wenxiniae]